MSNIDFTVLGGGQEIGANSYLVSSAEIDILLDCGIHPKKEGLESLPDLFRLNRAPQAAVVSHGHVDHCGAIPKLLKQFPDVNVYTSGPTARIMDRMLHNSVAVMEMLGRNEGVHDYPLYSHEDVGYAMRCINTVGMDNDFELECQSPVRARFFSAGHVLGSATSLLELPNHTILYTGDLCSRDQELVAGHSLMEEDIQVETLIMESTRGAQDKDDGQDYEYEIERFAVESKKVFENGGVVLVPSFALGRSQEILNIISRLQRSGMLPSVPVYSSGLGRAIYEIYSSNRDYLKPNAGIRPLKEFSRVGNVWETDIVLELLSEPCFIVATSGMMVENTPSAMIAKELVRSNKHGMFFVGYLDPDTLGYRVLHSKPGDKMAFERPGRNVKMVMENRKQFSFSAHASRNELRKIITKLNPRNVVFVHGDSDAVEWMEENCDSRARKYAPMIGQTITLEL